MKTLVALLIFLSAHIAFAQPCEVAQNVEVRGERITLLDLCPQGPQSFSSVTLGVSPQPGREIVLSGREIQKAAGREFGAGELVVPANVSITLASRRISPSEVEGAVLDAIAQEHGEAGEVRVIEISSIPEVRQGEVTFDVKLNRGALIDRSLVWTDVYVDGRREARVSSKILLKPQSFKTLVLARSMQRGEFITPDCLEERTLKPEAGAVTNYENAIGKVMARSAQKGAQIKENMIFTPFDVKKNDVVRLSVKVGTVVAITTGKSLVNARIGEEVAVVNLTSKRVLSGTLKEAGVVEIHSATQEVN